MSNPRPDAFLPGPVPIDSYGDGGFRFADMSHRGSLLMLPSGVHAWAATSPADIDATTLAPVIAEAGAVEFLLVGTGPNLVPLSEALRWALRDANIRTEAMATGAAIRTYNILLGERRRVAAALLAVA